MHGVPHQSLELGLWEVEHARPTNERRLHSEEAGRGDYYERSAKGVATVHRERIMITVCVH